MADAKKAGASEGPSLEAIQDATHKVNEAAEALERRQQLRELNLAPTRPGEAELKQLDASMKRNSAIIRKLRALSEESRASLLDDIAKTNQSKVCCVG